MFNLKMAIFRILARGVLTRFLGFRIFLLYMGVLTRFVGFRIFCILQGGRRSKIVFRSNNINYCSFILGSVIGLQLLERINCIFGTLDEETTIFLPRTTMILNLLSAFSRYFSFYKGAPYWIYRFSKKFSFYKGFLTIIFPVYIRLKHLIPEKTEKNFMFPLKFIGNNDKVCIATRQIFGFKYV